MTERRASSTSPVSLEEPSDRLIIYLLVFEERGRYLKKKKVSENKVGPDLLGESLFSLKSL